MSKKLDREYLLSRLSTAPDMVLATAYLYAVNYTQFGCDVTKAWTTAILQNEALNRAYVRGYHEAMERFYHQEESTNSIFDADIDEHNIKEN